MNKRTTILIVVAAMALLVFIILFLQKDNSERKSKIIPASWKTGYEYDSRDPYGGYIFYELLKNSTKDFTTIEGDPYDYLNDQQFFSEDQLLVVYSGSYTNRYSTWSKIGDFVKQGNHVLLILDEDPTNLKLFYTDIFKVESSYRDDTKLHFEKEKAIYLFEKLNNFEPEDYSWNHFAVRNYVDLQPYVEPGAKPGALYDPDANKEICFYVHEVNEKGKPVYVEFPLGDGSVLIHRTPIAFSNISLLKEKNEKHLEKVLSVIEYNSIAYNIGQNPLTTDDEDIVLFEKTSPLQFILDNPSLTWAYYLVLASLLLFVLFNLKRKQKVVPVMPSKDNTTVEYVDAMSKVYFYRHNNKNIVLHKQRYFNTFIRSRYNINLNRKENEAARIISAKSGVDEEEIKLILSLTAYYLKIPSVSDEQLMKLHIKLDNFYKTCK